MKLVKVENIRWANEAQTSILADCWWDNGVDGPCSLLASGDYPWIHEAYQEAVRIGVSPYLPPVADLESIIAGYKRVFETVVAGGVASLGYSSIVEASTYLFSTNSRWATEARRLLDWRDKMEQRLYLCIDAVRSGQLHMSNAELEIFIKEGLTL